MLDDGRKPNELAMAAAAEDVFDGMCEPHHWADLDHNDEKCELELPIGVAEDEEEEAAAAAAAAATATAEYTVFLSSPWGVLSLSPLLFTSPSIGIIAPMVFFQPYPTTIRIIDMAFVKPNSHFLFQTTDLPLFILHIP